MSSAAPAPAPGAPPQPIPAIEDVRMTKFTTAGGCACKLKPQLLEGVLRNLPPITDPRVLVATETSDDAAVYRVTDDIVAVHTIDFFTPVVDDPYDFGAVAATNAISDVYAMGASPATALSVVAFPSARLPMAALERILQGAADKCREAGVSIVGGHSIDDTEPKFGLSVTGYGHPDRILRNSGGRPGDVLVLTKPLGTGILTQAMKRGVASAEEAAACIRSMTTLNRAAAEAAATVGAAVHACTDVTGFGLMGHLHEMTAGSKVDADVEAAAVPLMPGVLAHAAAGVLPGGSKNNAVYVSPWVQWAEAVEPARRAALCDAQTSGGLLFAVAPEAAEALIAELRARNTLAAARIGRLTAPGPGTIRVC